MSEGEDVDRSAGVYARTVKLNVPLEPTTMSLRRLLLDGTVLCPSAIAQSSVAALLVTCCLFLVFLFFLWCS
jgi:hypothetical protein